MMMHTWLFCSILMFVTAISAINFSDLPKCKKSDPNIDKCLVKNIQVALDLLCRKGIPELGLPILEPLEIPEIVLDTNATVVSVVQKYTNVKLYGYAITKIEKAHLDFDKKILTFSHFTPIFTQKASYNLDGNVLFLPIHGSGKSEISLLNSTGAHTIFFEEKKSGNNIYLNVKQHFVKFETSGLVMDYENLFDGNKEFSDSILKVFNENWEALWDDVKSILEKAYGEVFQSLSRRFFSIVPLNQIFLE